MKYNITTANNGDIKIEVILIMGTWQATADMMEELEKSALNHENVASQ